MITIPLNIREMKFCKVHAGAKDAFEPGRPTYTWNDSQLTAHLASGGNYGVVGDEKHLIIDCDTEELAMAVRNRLPETFTVTSATKKMPHYYYRCSWKPRDIPILDRTLPKEQWNIGTVRGKGYVVGPWSSVDGNLYTPSNNLGYMALVTEQQVLDFLAPWIAERTLAIDREEWKGNGLEFPISRILPSGLKQTGHRYQGPHPIHGSTTGVNFNVDLDKNVWYCFRCCAGGGPLELLGVLEHIIDCADAGPGALRGELFTKTRAKAIERGLIPDPAKPRKAKKQDKPQEPREYPWKEAGETVPCLDEKALFDILVSWLKRYLDLKEARYYPVLAAWIMHTWLVEDWRATGPLYLLGQINTGKTTVLECLEETAYLGIRGGSMSISTMFRLSHAYGPCFLVDESQLYNREEWAETQSFINERYRKGGKVWRCENMGEGNIVPVFFNAYGATAFASDSPPWPALTSRALIFHMEKNRLEVEQTLTPTFESEGQRFRDLLKGFREKWKGRLAGVQIAGLETLGDYRTREIGYPLLAIPKSEQYQADVLAYLTSLEEEHQVEEETSEASDYIRALNQCQPENGKVTALEIQDKLADVLGLVTLKVKTGVLGEEAERVVDKRLLPAPRTILKVMVTLGFKKKAKIGPLSRTGILWDMELLKRLNQRYRISSESSESSEGPHE